MIKDSQTIAAVMAAQKTSNGYVGLFLRKQDKEGKPLSPEQGTEFLGDKILDMESLYKVGVFAQVRSINRVATGAQLFITGMRRINLDMVQSFGPPAVAKVNHWPTQRMAPLTKVVKAYTNELLYASRYCLSVNFLFYHNFFAIENCLRSIRQLMAS